MLLLLVTANVVPSSPFLVTLTMEAMHSSETLVLTRATRRSIPEDGSLKEQTLIFNAVKISDGITICVRAFVSPDFDRSGNKIS
jgi:hypothetical protein